MNPFDSLRRTERAIGYFLCALVAFLVSLAFFVGTANAQTVPGSARLAWTLPTTGCTTGVTPCDNVPLSEATALTAVEVYISTSPIPDTSTMDPTLTLAAGATTAQHTLQVANGATLYARIKAVNADLKSPFSAQVSKLIRLPVAPGVPSDVTIDIVITG